MHIRKTMKLILAEQVVVYFSHVDFLSYSLLSGHHQQLTLNIVCKYFGLFEHKYVTRISTDFL